MALEVVKGVTRKYPVTRGMIGYSVLWPMANICEQVLSGKEKLDVKQIVQFSIFGTLFTAPTVYGWVKISSRLVQSKVGRPSLLVGLKKALIEQFTYSPFAVSSFLIGMNVLEGRSLDHTSNELSEKFLPTWKTAACFWPVVQTINFTYIPERNRVVFTAVFSFLWTCFLSYVKHHDIPAEESETSKS